MTEIEKTEAERIELANKSFEELTIYQRNRGIDTSKRKRIA